MSKYQITIRAELRNEAGRVVDVATFGVGFDSMNVHGHGPWSGVQNAIIEALTPDPDTSSDAEGEKR